MVDDRICAKISRSSVLGHYLESKFNQGSTYVDALEELLPESREDDLINAFDRFRHQVSALNPWIDGKIESLRVIFLKCIVYEKQLDDEAVSTLIQILNKPGKGGL